MQLSGGQIPAKSKEAYDYSSGIHIFFIAGGSGRCFPKEAERGRSQRKSRDYGPIYTKELPKEREGDRCPAPGPFMYTAVSTQSFNQSTKHPSDGRRE